MASTALALRFWAKCTITPDCWVWNGNTKKGVPMLKSNGGRNIRATSASWLIHKHTVVPNGMIAKPKCGNSLCVSPYHLEIVESEATQQRRTLF